MQIMEKIQPAAVSASTLDEVLIRIESWAVEQFDKFEDAKRKGDQEKSEFYFAIGHAYTRAALELREFMYSPTG